MADTRVQLEVENWIRSNGLPPVFGREFSLRSIGLRSGGTFEFDAVSADGSVIGLISTSSARTAQGKRGSGKLMKLRADMLMLVLAEAEHRVLIFTEASMHELLEQEKVKGRVPPEITFHLVALPEQLRRKLEASRRISSLEVTPTPSDT